MSRGTWVSDLCIADNGKKNRKSKNLHYGCTDLLRESDTAVRYTLYIMYDETVRGVRRAARGYKRPPFFESAYRVGYVEWFILESG